MNFEKYCTKLPSFVKYNQYLYNFSFKIANKLHNINNHNTQLYSQYKLLISLFASYDLKIKGTIQNIQILYVELSKFFDNTCNNYEINYWLDYGILLELIRYDDFIL